jgi:hypothetical protein
MITNHLLEEKYRVQRELAHEAGHDTHQYMKNVRSIVAETERQYGIEFKYYDAGEREAVKVTDS